MAFNVTSDGGFMTSQGSGFEAALGRTANATASAEVFYGSGVQRTIGSRDFLTGAAFGTFGFPPPAFSNPSLTAQVANPFAFNARGGFGLFSPDAQHALDWYFNEPPPPPPQMLPSQAAPTHAGGSAPTAAPANTMSMDGGTESAPAPTGSTKSIPKEDRTTGVDALKGHGYSADDAHAIISRIAAKAAGDPEVFRTLVEGVPAKTNPPEREGESPTPNPDWHLKFGRWAARELLGLDKESAKEFVFKTTLHPTAPGTADHSVSVGYKREEVAADGKVYDVYGFDDAGVEGALAQQAVAGLAPQELYRDNDKKWFKRTSTGVFEPFPIETFEASTERVVVRHTDWIPNNYADVREYLADLDGEITSFRHGLTSHEEDERAIKADHGQAAADAIREILPEPVRSKFGVNFADGRPPRLTVEVKKGDAQEVHAALTALNGDPPAQAKLNALFRELPPGTAVEFRGEDGEARPLRTTEAALPQLSRQVDLETPKPLTITRIDASSVRRHKDESDDDYFKRIAGRISEKTVARIEHGERTITRHPDPIVVQDFLLPSGVTKEQIRPLLVGSPEAEGGSAPPTTARIMHWSVRFESYSSPPPPSPLPTGEPPPPPPPAVLPPAVPPSPVPPVPPVVPPAATHEHKVEEATAAVAVAQKSVEAAER